MFPGAVNMDAGPVQSAGAVWSPGFWQNLSSCGI